MVNGLEAAADGLKGWSDGRRGRRWRSRPGPAAGIGVAQAQERDAPGLVPQGGDTANDGDCGRSAVNADGSGDAAGRDHGKGGDGEGGEPLRSELVAEQQLPGQLAKRDQAGSHQQASQARPRAVPHACSICGASATGQT